MKIVITAIVVAVLAFLVAWAIDIDVTGDVELPEVTNNLALEGGELPNVEVTGDVKMPEVTGGVDVEGGNMPDVDVETVDIDVEQEPMTIETPDIDVDMKERTISVPTLSIDKPEEDTEAEEDDLNNDM